MMMMMMMMMMMRAQITREELQRAFDDYAEYLGRDRAVAALQESTGAMCRRPRSS